MLAAEENQPDRTERILSDAAQMLNDLFDTPLPIVIHGHSLQVLAGALFFELNESVRNGTESELLEKWKRNLPAFRNNMMKLANENPLKLADGSYQPLMTEDKSARLTTNLRKCPPPPMD